MATKGKSQRWGTEKKWFSSSEAARYLGVSVDTIRQLDESGQLRATRTKGGHRRFSRKALDAYLARSGRDNKRKEEHPKLRSCFVSRPEPDPAPFADDVEDFEPGDEDFEP